MVQRLRLHPSNAGGVGLIFGWETKIPHAVLFSQKKFFLNFQRGKTGGT